MGNFNAYSMFIQEYNVDEIILNVNSFAQTDKQLNYVIWKADYNDDEDTDEYNSDTEKDLYLDRFYSRYNH